MSCLDCKNGHRQDHTRTAFRGLGAHCVEFVFHGMNYAHPPQHLLLVQPERQQTTHQCCLEDGAHCRDMAGYFHCQQKQLDALELKEMMQALVLVS